MGEAGGMGRADTLLKADLEGVASRRRNFVGKPTVESLMLYADAIEQESYTPSALMSSQRQ